MTAASAADGDDAANLYAGALALHPDFRVLRRLAPLRRELQGGVPPGLVGGVALDIETTGLDHRTDRIVELCMRRFWTDASGRIVAVGDGHEWLEDPGRPLSAEVTRLTGLTDGMLSGRSIFDPVATTIILDVDFVVSHNAAFDRPFLEARLPEASGAPWICTLAGVDWRGQGFEGRSLGHLLLQMGWFFEAHRAAGDVDALLRLLDHPLATGRTVLATAFASASAATLLVEARGAPFPARDVLRRRGYRWDPSARLWWREVAESEGRSEIAWAEAEVYGGEGTPDTTRITWRERYRARAVGRGAAQRDLRR